MFFKLLNLVTLKLFMDNAICCEVFFTLFSSHWSWRLFTITNKDDEMVLYQQVVRFFMYAMLCIWLNSQHGSSLGSVRVLSLTLFCILGGMKMRLPGLVLATPLQALCLGRELKAKVATIFFQIVIWITRYFANIEKCIWPQSNVQTWINHAYWVCLEIKISKICGLRFQTMDHLWKCPIVMHLNQNEIIFNLHIWGSLVVKRM